MTKKTKIINIGKGSQAIDYAKVSERVGEFHKENKKNAITTTYEFKDGWVIFKATVTPNYETSTRCFTGTSMGKIAALKAFEKLETIAVGRALAFAGYLSNGEIASSDEMEDFNDGKPVIETNGAIEKLKNVNNIDELKKVWLGLTQAERDNAEVLQFKEIIKDGFGSITKPGSKVTGGGGMGYGPSTMVELSEPTIQIDEDLPSGTTDGGVESAPQGKDNGDGPKKTPRKQNA